MVMDMSRTVEECRTLKRLNKYASGEIYGAGVIARRFKSLNTEAGYSVSDDGTPRPFNWLKWNIHKR